MKYNLLGFVLILWNIGCGVNHTTMYDDAVKDIPDPEIEAYVNTICLSLGGHIGYEAIGHCSQCGGMTPCCNMQICDRCAAARGVCPFCLKKVDWTKNTDPDTEVPLLLAILARYEDIRARQVAVYALIQIREEGTLEFMMRYANEKLLARELSRAVGEFKDERFIFYLERALKQYTTDDYLGEGDIEEQYYLSQAAQEAASGLAAINNERSIAVLLRSAEYGKLWERVFAIRALAQCPGEKVRTVLTGCLDEFFAKKDDWKWIPGRDLIGATLDALAHTGNKENALQVLEYMRNPGCDFLYEDLKKCLAAIGQPAIPDMIVMVRQDLKDGIFDWGRLSIIEALGEIGDTAAVPFLMELIDMEYPDEYTGRDFIYAAQQSLNKIHSQKPDVSPP
jgi:HEAT repeat protein